MRRNWLALICVILIVIISAIDNYYFNNPTDVAETKRKLFHFLFLALTMVIGYIPFTKSELKWTRQLWIISYTLVFIIILGTGVLNKLLHLSTDLMDEVFRLRVWFCSPLPFMAIFVLSKLKGFIEADSK